jgi:prevent-host-death family protein
LGVQVDIHEAKAQLCRLLELVEKGESVVIARHGKPVAELVRARKTGLPPGIAQQDRLAPPGDEWWQPMTAEEADDWVQGQ